jgi:hypothetical protein
MFYLLRTVRGRLPERGLRVKRLLAGGHGDFGGVGGAGGLVTGGAGGAGGGARRYSGSLGLRKGIFSG